MSTAIESAARSTPPYGRKRRLQRVQQLTAMILVALSPRINPCR
jgi:hypothetical protein